MGRYWAVAVGLLTLVLALFVVVEALGVPLLVDPTPWLARPGIAAALLGVGLLVADVAVPVPSSIVMVAHGALFGVVLGTVLSLLGSTRPRSWGSRSGAAAASVQLSAHRQPAVAFATPSAGPSKTACYFPRSARSSSVSSWTRRAAPATAAATCWLRPSSNSSQRSG
jgi:hypothetical protein